MDIFTLTHIYFIIRKDYHSVYGQVIDNLSNLLRVHVVEKQERAPNQC